MTQSKSSFCRLVILVSGRGSNMRNIVQTIEKNHLPAKVVAVIANDEQAEALTWAKQRNLETRTVSHKDYRTREQFDRHLAGVVADFAPDYVLLAGFMRILTPAFVENFEGRLINIHPSLLPAFPGLHTHRQALLYGVQWHGCTVHFVTAELDSGPVIAQGVVPVMTDDTEDSLAARVLETEHRVYGQVVQWLAAGALRLDKGRVFVDGVDTRGVCLAPATTMDNTDGSTT